MGLFDYKEKKIPEGILGSNGIALYPDSSGNYMNLIHVLKFVG